MLTVLPGEVHQISGVWKQMRKTISSAGRCVL